VDAIHISASRWRDGTLRKPLAFHPRLNIWVYQFIRLVITVVRATRKAKLGQVFVFRRFRHYAFIFQRPWYVVFVIYLYLSRPSKPANSVPCTTLTTMAPQTSIPLAANILGTIGTVCWCVQLLPQIWRNYRTKSTEGLPASMMLLWSISGVPFGVYAIAQQFNIPLIVQPQCFCVLCGVSWAQCLIYSG
jgi:uncharacterized protein with PQ loop repeat